MPNITLVTCVFIVTLKWFGFENIWWCMNSSIETKPVVSPTRSDLVSPPQTLSSYPSICSENLSHQTYTHKNCTHILTKKLLKKIGQEKNTINNGINLWRTNINIRHINTDTSTPVVILKYNIICHIGLEHNTYLIMGRTHAS